MPDLVGGIRAAWRFTLKNVRDIDVTNVVISALSLFLRVETNCVFADPASKSSAIYSDWLRQLLRWRLMMRSSA